MEIREKYDDQFRNFGLRPVLKAEKKVQIRCKFFFLQFFFFQKGAVNAIKSQQYLLFQWTFKCQSVKQTVVK